MLMYMYAAISNDFEIVAMEMIDTTFICLQAMATAKHGRKL